MSKSDKLLIKNKRIFINPKYIYIENIILTEFV